MRYPLTLLALLLVVAACSPSPEGPITEVPRDQRTPLPTVPPPNYREPFLPVVVDNAPSVELLGRLDPPRTGVGSVTSYAFSADSTRLAVLTRELLLGWDLLNGELVFSVDGRGASRMYYSTDKTEVYTLDTAGLVRVVNGESGTQVTTFTAEPNFSGDAAYEPFNGYLAVASREGVIRVWDPFTREELVSLTARDPRVTDLAFSADGATLAISTSAGAVELWDWRNDELTALLATEAAATEPIGRVALAPNGQQVAAGTTSDVRLWDIGDRVVTAILLTGEGGSEDILSYTPDGAYIINSGTTEAMNIWDPATGELVASQPELGNQPTAATFNPSGELMLASVFQGGAFIYNLGAANTEGGITRAPLETDTTVIDVAWSPDGRALILFDARGAAYVFGIAAPPPTPTPELLPTVDLGVAPSTAND